jgi:hypothetical protein
MDATVKYPNRWPAGTSGNLNGRPVGSRTAFSNAFMRDLAEVWATEGRRCVEHTAKASPETFFAVCSKLIPKDVQLIVEQTMPRGLEPEDLAILRAIKQSLPDANSRTPSEVLNYVLNAIRSYGAHQIIDARDNESRGQGD